MITYTEVLQFNSVTNEDILLLRKPGNISCGRKLFLEKTGASFCLGHKFVCPPQMLRAGVNTTSLRPGDEVGVNRETFVSQQCVHVCQGLF